MGEGLIKGAELETWRGDISLEEVGEWVEVVIASGRTRRGSSRGSCIFGLRWILAGGLGRGDEALGVGGIDYRAPKPCG